MMCEASRELGIHRMRTKYLDVSRDNMAYVKQRRHTKQRTRKIIRCLLDLPVKDTRSAEKARQRESLCRALLGQATRRNRDDNEDIPSAA